MNLRSIFDSVVSLQRGRIVDMARINKQEGSEGLFPYDSWEIRMWSNDHNPPHFHIIKDGWNVSFLVDTGEVFKVEKKGRKKDIYAYMVNNVKDWLDTKCFIEPSITNRRNAINVWSQIHD